jgi:flagellar hook assembly protein FlgD
MQNWPNPFSPTTHLEYNIPEAGHVTLGIFNAAGRLVRTLVNREVEPGRHTESWDGTGDDGALLSRGVYFARLEMAGASRVRKLVLLR